ncbi:MAG TPA: hypothetical protein VFF11_01755, partial [Candidatus Binatia bacterium]|nr:hypothetical protein [Candidatus Binatia bacterium]
MNLIKSLSRTVPASKPAIVLFLFSFTTAVPAQPATNAPVPVLQINAGQVKAKVSPRFYGLMTEEINYSYEGGIYGELVRNRTFMASPTNAVFWKPAGNTVIS